MILLSDLLGRRVLCESERIGSVVDVVIAADGPEPRIEALVIGRHGHQDVIAWRDVLACGEAVIVEADRSTAVVAPETRLARRDVLDAQVLDMRGRSHSRVGDLELILDRTPRLSAAQIGPASVLRRLGLRRTARRLPTGRVPWASVNLLRHPVPDASARRPHRRRFHVMRARRHAPS